MNDITQSELLKAAKELAKIYYLTDTNPRAIDRDKKERLYALASRYPEAHYIALEINNACFRSR